MDSTGPAARANASFCSDAVQVVTEEERREAGQQETTGPGGRAVGSVCWWNAEFTYGK